jgi:hypothetical protein
MEKMDKVGSDLLGIDVETVETPEEIKETPKEPKEEPKVPVIHIDDFENVVEIVKKENEIKQTNPSAVLDGEAGINFIEGEPHLVIDDKYVPHKEALIVLQTRKVVREWLKLENLKKGIIE